MRLWVRGAFGGQDSGFRLFGFSGFGVLKSLPEVWRCALHGFTEAHAGCVESKWGLTIPLPLQGVGAEPPCSCLSFRQLNSGFAVNS